MNNDLKLIKKHYGEKMMHLCRELFPTLLEQEGYLSKLMLDNFAPSRFLYDDIVEDNYIEKFKNYIYEIADLKSSNEIKKDKTPRELLNEAGYELYECKTEEDIQKFKKYYRKDEELCTFDGDRLDNCYVFFAVKKNVDEIERENFKEPKRQDEYGTSVISIQFSRGRVNTLSIKNRYNHTVSNPDATFSNNLENIISGLTYSFKKEYNLNISQNNSTEFDLDGYVQADDGKFYKYNYEINNIYYCPNNIIIDNFEVKQYPKEKYIILDYFVLDLVNKKIELYDKAVVDCFSSDINNIIKINLTKNDKQGNINVKLEVKKGKEITLELDNRNRIIGYKNDNLNKIGDYFLYKNFSLEWIETPNAKKIGNSVLRNNEALIFINFPKVEKIGYGFLYNNERILNINLPRVKEIGDEFLYCNINLKYVNLPLVEIIGNHFLKSNRELSILEMNKVRQIGDRFLFLNRQLTYINLPCLIIVCDNFLYYNEKIKNVNLPSLEVIGMDFLYHNNEIVNLFLPKLLNTAMGFLHENTKLKVLYLLEFSRRSGIIFLDNLNKVKLYIPKLSVNDREYLSFDHEIIETLFDSEIELYESQIKKAQIAQDKLKEKIQKAINKELNGTVKVKKK